MKRPSLTRVLVVIPLYVNFFAASTVASTLLWNTPTESGGPPLFSADGTRIFRGGNIFDAATGVLIKTLPRSTWLLVPRDPALIALFSSDRTLSIVRIEDGKVLQTFQNVGYAAFLDNGATVYTAFDGGSVFVVDSDSAEPPAVIDAGANVTVSATANFFLVSDDLSDPLNPHRSRLFSYENHVLKETDIGKPPPLSYAAQLSADGKSILGVIYPTGVFVYDIGSKTIRWQRSIPGDYVYKLAWLAGDTQVFVSTPATMTALKADTGEVVWDKPGSPLIADVSPDKKLLLGLDSASSMYDATTGELKRFNDFGFGSGRGITISPDGKRVAYANINGNVICRDVVSGQILWSTLVRDPASNYYNVFRQLAASRDWSLLFATRLGSPLSVETYVLNASDGRLLKIIRTGMPGNPDLPDLAVVAGSSDNKLLAVGDLDAVTLANLETGETIRSWRPEPNAFAAGIAFVQNDQSIAVGISSAKLKIIPIADGSQIQTLEGGGGSMALSRDGALLAGTDSAYFSPAKHVIVRNASDLSTLYTFTPSTTPTGVTFSGDGKFLLVGGDKEITVWNLATGRQTDSISAAQSPSIGWLSAVGNSVAVGGAANVQMYSAVSGLRANLAENSISLTWQSLTGPFAIESAPSLEGPWTTATTLEENSIQFPVGPGQKFFRMQAP